MSTANAYCYSFYKLIKFFEELLTAARALPASFEIITSPRQRRHLALSVREFGHGSRTRRCGWSVLSFHGKGGALRKNCNSNFFSVVCS